MPRYLDPKNDFIFKKIFGNHPDLLKSFLNAILPLPQDCVIESLSYLVAEQIPELARIFHPYSAAACESLMQTALDSGLSLGGMSNTALRSNSRPPCLHHAALRLATNRYEISGLEGFKSTIVDVRCKDNHGRYFIVEMQMEWIKDFVKRMLYNTTATYTRQLKKGEPYQKLSPVYGLALINDKFQEGEEWFHHFKMMHTENPKKTLDDIQLVLIELPKLKPTTITEKNWQFCGSVF